MRDTPEWDVGCLPERRPIFEPERRVLLGEAEKQGVDAQAPSQPAADEGQAIADQCRWADEEPR